MENTRYINTSTESKNSKLLVPCHGVPGSQGDYSLSFHSIPTSWPYQTPSIWHNGYFQPACHVQIEPSWSWDHRVRPPSSPVAVTGVGVAAAGAVAGPAAVGPEAPVAGQAVVTAGPCHAGLAGTVPGAGVTEGAGAQGQHGRSHGVAGASCRGGTPWATEHLWVHNLCITEVQEMPAKPPLRRGTPLGLLSFFIPHPYKSEQSLPLEPVEF